MKRIISSNGLFLLGFLVLGLTNYVVLSGVASNRSGEVQSQLVLSERELQLPYRMHEENSGLNLRIIWRTLSRNPDEESYYGGRSPAWFDAGKLKELGFKEKDNLHSKSKGNSYKRQIPKEVYIVLENGGESYREAVKRAELALAKSDKKLRADPEEKPLIDNVATAKRNLEREQFGASRLFAIDAGLDYRVLRSQYEDKTRFLVVKGLVKPGYRYRESEDVYGIISKLSVTGVQVPLKHRQLLDTVITQGRAKKSATGAPRFQVELAYGSRLEPWILSVESL